MCGSRKKTMFLIAETFAKTVEVDRFSSFTTIISTLFVLLVWCGMMYHHQSNGIMTEILKVCMVNSLRGFRFGKGSSLHSSGTWWWFGSYCFLDFNDLAAGHMDRDHVKPTLNGPGHPLAPPRVGSLFHDTTNLMSWVVSLFCSRIPTEDCFVFFFCVEDGGKETTQWIIPIVISMFLIFKLFMPYQANQIKLPTLKQLPFPKADWQQVYRVRNRCSTSWKLSFFSTCLMFLYCELFCVRWLSRFKMSFYWWNNVWH